jgi:hypothetical protein
MAGPIAGETPGAPEPDPRERVWIALSDLYLDADVDDVIAPCARVLAQSPFSRDELHAILFDEVHPVLVVNLLSVAGEWAGFDAAWLCARIRERRMAWWPPLTFSRWRLRGEMRALWQRVDAIIAVLRSPEPRA